jgi:lysophospholipase L1-like esterase
MKIARFATVIVCTHFLFASFAWWQTEARPQIVQASTTMNESSDESWSAERKLAEIKTGLQKKWPKNKTIRFVFHGHSVPAGYFKTPKVRRFDSYPTLTHQKLCQKFPTAVIDVCVTAIGGESSGSGAKRFESDVLSLKPDVVFIDYSLNDRFLGLDKSKAAWQLMIEQCIAKNILVVLLTPTPDSNEDITDSESPLALHRKQLLELAAKYKVHVVDSHAEFQRLVQGGKKVKDFLSQPNHPNRKGHEVVTRLITKMF